MRGRNQHSTDDPPYSKLAAWFIRCPHCGASAMTVCRKPSEEPYYHVRCRVPFHSRRIKTAARLALAATITAAFGD